MKYIRIHPHVFHTLKHQLHQIRPSLLTKSTQSCCCITWVIRPIGHAGRQYRHDVILCRGFAYRPSGQNGVDVQIHFGRQIILVKRLRQKTAFGTSNIKSLFCIWTCLVGTIVSVASPTLTTTSRCPVHRPKACTTPWRNKGILLPNQNKPPKKKNAVLILNIRIN